jgi:hypothetical protein
LPLAAEAMIGVRVGLEAPVISHNEAGTNYIGSPFEPSLNVMVSYYVFEEVASLDLELSEGIGFNEPNMSGVQRTGTTLRPGVTLHPPLLPVYFGAFLPLHLEPSPFVVSARVAVGLQFPVLIFKLYIETTADFPLGGGTGAPGAFKQQIFSLGSGLQAHF